MIQGWIGNLNYSRILPLLAFLGSRIVADATLHRESGGWSRHLGKVRMTIDPEFRASGLARQLLQERFGHTAFRPGQWEPLKAVLHGEDALVVMRGKPTDVTLTFDRATTAWARDRQWHPSQQVSISEDG